MSEAIFGLIMLTLMEIVLGIDNIIFITIVTGRLPKSQQPLAWRVGLGLAMLIRILLLFAIAWILGLTEPIFTLESLGIAESWIVPQDVTDPLLAAEWQHFWHEVNAVSWRDIILLGGGLFLVAKSVHEIHRELDDDHQGMQASRPANLTSVLVQIVVLDVIFSLDSVITAVGMVSRDKLWVMVTAIILAVIVMVTFAQRVGQIVQRNPTLKMLALSFLIMIGVMLLAEGIGTQFDKRYVYFAMVFALAVEGLNMRLRKKKVAPSPS